MGRIFRPSYFLFAPCVFISFSPTALYAQNIPPNPVEQERARVEAEWQAAERAARENAPRVSLPTEQAVTLGAFPEETPCFEIKKVEIIGNNHPRLRWAPAHLQQFVGRCAGVKGLDYILRSMQQAFLDRGFITTRAGLPEQDLSSGVLQVQIVPGVVSAVRTNKEDKSFTWGAASPVDTGDLVTLRALEQGLEQMRRIPGREVKVDMAPGDEPGATILDVASVQKRPLSANVSLNNFAGRTVGRWQGSGQVTALGVLGLSELITASYNQRIDSPGLPANSQGSGINISFPLGWWTFGVAGNKNDYNSRVVGQVRDFDTRGTLRSLSGYAELVAHRDRTSKTSLRATISRRWARNYIDDIEIGIQRQDLSDIEIAAIDKRSLGNLRVDSVIAYRVGTNWFGAQEETKDRPAALPTARYHILTADVAATLPLSKEGLLESWRFAFRGQYSHKPLYGSDSFSVGGPFSVRGFDSDRSDMARSGWYMRNEVTFRVIDQIRPYALFDIGKVRDGEIMSGIGIGARAYWKGFNFDGFVAVPLTDSPHSTDKKAQIGVSVGWGF